MYVSPIKNINIYIAYNPLDKVEREEFVAYLKRVEPPKGKAMQLVWYDGSDLSKAGRAWISQLVDAADVMIVLLTKSSVLSPYFSCKEMRYAIDKHENEQLKILPVILQTCWWEDSLFRKFEVLPRGALPILDSKEVKEKLYQQIQERIAEEIEKSFVRKQERWDGFAEIVREANGHFTNWEQQPELLQKAIPLYEEALEHWQEGFHPGKDWLSQRIAFCHREIDFRHYARSAKEAYQVGDFEAVYFNCKDALRLRNDADISKLYAQVKEALEEEKMKIRREPFEKHLEKANYHFLALNLGKAQKEFQAAIEIWEQGFEPHERILRKKIEICRREALLEEAMSQADRHYKNLEYPQLISCLMDAVQDMHRKAFRRMEETMELMELLEYAEPFRDSRANRWGFLDKRNQQVVIAAKYMAAFGFSEGLAAVKKLDTWGFIDIEGREIIPFQYKFVGHFSDGRVEVFTASDAYYIDKQGRRLDVEEEETQSLEKK